MAEDDEDYSLTEEEYLRWYLPSEALALVAKQLRDSDARALILKRIADEDLFTAARKIIVTSAHRERKPRYFERLSKKRWADARALLSHPLWRTNDVVFTESGSTMRSPSTTFSCVEVRFDPEGVERLLPSPSTRRQERTSEAINQMVETVTPSIERFAASMKSVATQHVLRQLPPSSVPPRDGEIAATAVSSENVPAPHKPAKVPPNELSRWYRAQFAENPGLAFHEVQALAEAHFRPRRVTRQPLRNVIGELGHTQGQGNPAFRRK